jgi:hypothetical protein
MGHENPASEFGMSGKTVDDKNCNLKIRLHQLGRHEQINRDRAMYN